MRSLDFVLGHVWFYEDGSNRLPVKIQIWHSQGHELTDLQTCIEHKHGHTVVTDRLDFFVMSTGIAEQSVKEFFTFGGFKCWWGFAAHRLLLLPGFDIEEALSELALNNFSTGNAIYSYLSVVFDD